MRKFIIFVLCLLLSGCKGAVKGSDQNLFSWQIYAKDTLIKNHLSTESIITHYDGSSEKVTISQNAENGKVFVIIQLQIKKAKSGGTTFSWEKLSLKDSKGNAYSRIDDSFLIKHEFERLTPLEIRLGDNVGWIAFEIPEVNSKSKLILYYQADEGENKILVKP